MSRAAPHNYIAAEGQQLALGNQQLFSHKQRVSANIADSEMLPVPHCKFIVLADKPRLKVMHSRDCPVTAPLEDVTGAPSECMSSP